MIDWTGIDDFEDSEITYLLYMEGLSVGQIVKIRNIDATLINDHIIKEKLKRRTTSKNNKELRPKLKSLKNNATNSKINGNTKNKSKIAKYKDENSKIHKVLKIQPNDIKYKDVNSYLIMDKEDRLNLIQNIDGEDIVNFKKDIYTRMVYEENADDLMALIWTAGELKDPGYIPLIISMASKGHASIRRLSYSALGKIAHEDGLSCLYDGLSDQMPQCRQYAAIAIGKIGNRESLSILKEAYQKEKMRSNIKEYILRAIEKAIDEIKQKY